MHDNVYSWSMLQVSKPDVIINVPRAHLDSLQLPGDTADAHRHTWYYNPALISVRAGMVVGWACYGTIIQLGYVAQLIDAPNKLYCSGVNQRGFTWTDVERML